MSKLDKNLNVDDLNKAYFQPTPESDGYFDNELQWTIPEDIIGYPNMYNEYADVRIHKGKYGRIEYNTVLKDAPLVFIQPGIPKFMPKNTISGIFGQSESQLITKALASSGNGVPDEIRKIASKGNFQYDSRYYGFKPSYAAYTKFVNSMASYVAIRMGLVATASSDTSRSDIKMLSANRGGNFFTRTMLPVYADAGSTSFSEGSQNATAESMISSLSKNASQLAREAEFIFDGKMPVVGNILQSNMEKFNENISSQVGGIGDNVSGFMSKLGVGLESVVKGGMMMFPEIWQDSQYRKSYDIGVKLWSPYGDKLSIFNNIIFPLICLICLSLPRQTGRTTYAAPFLVKLYSKGWFNCDLGMIESISINKGENKSWSNDNLPLEVDVRLSVKDMYPTMMMTVGKYGSLYGYNTGLIEFLDTLSGVGVGEPDYLLGLKAATFGTAYEIINNLNSLVLGIEESTIGQMFASMSGFLGDLGIELNDIIGNMKDNVNNMFTTTDKDISTSEDDTGKGNYEEVETPPEDGTNPPGDDSKPPSSKEIKNKKNRDHYINKSYKKFNF